VLPSPRSCSKPSRGKTPIATLIAFLALASGAQALIPAQAAAMANYNGGCVWNSELNRWELSGFECEAVEVDGQTVMTVGGVYPVSGSAPSTSPSPANGLPSQTGGTRPQNDRDRVTHARSGAPVTRAPKKPGNNAPKKPKASPGECSKLADDAMIGTPIDDSDPGLQDERRIHLSLLQAELIQRKDERNDEIRRGGIGPRLPWLSERIKSLASNIELYKKLLYVAPGARREFEAKGCAKALGLKL
jgi:hypothetical protein